MDDLLIASWNVNGIRAVQRKQLLPWDQLPEVDIICTQETKARSEQVPPEVANPAGYHAYWQPAKKPGYSGVASFSKLEADEVIPGFGIPDYDDEGRVLGLRFGDLVIVNAYFPNSQEKGKRLDYKLGFCAAMETFLDSWLQRGCETVLLGDYNIAHEPIDLARPKQNESNAGYLPEERAWMTRYLELGFHDVYREWNPEEEGAYSWWSFRGGARSRNVGWRIDYATVSEGLLERVTEAQIHQDLMGSDHCPVSIAIGM